MADGRGDDPGAMSAEPAWRAMRPSDLDGVVAVAQLSFPDHPEDRACFANRLALYPQGCRVLAPGTDGPVRGYLIAYPWLADAAPALNVLIDDLPDPAALIYLHDLALHPLARGRGLTRPAVDHLVDQAGRDGWPAVALIAVNDAADFWRKQGFEASMPDGMARKLASYGPGARYMVRPTA